MRRLRVAVAVVALLGIAAGCTRNRPAVAPGSSPIVGTELVQAVVNGEDLSPRDLVEPEAKTERERLLVKAAEIYTFCQAWKIVEDIPEPVPGDPDELVRFGTRYYDTLRYIDLSKKVSEKVQTRDAGPATARRVEVSDEAKADVLTLRREVYGYLKRVMAARIAVRENAIDEKYAAARYEAAFFRLSADDVEAVYQRLTDYAHGHCSF